jgi:hypothetical protein
VLACREQFPGSLWGDGQNEEDRAHAGQHGQDREAQFVTAVASAMRPATMGPAVIPPESAGAA